MGHVTPAEELDSYWQVWLYAHATRNPVLAGTASALIKGWGARHTAVTAA